MARAGVACDETALGMAAIGGLRRCGFQAQNCCAGPNEADMRGEAMGRIGKFWAPLIGSAVLAGCGAPSGSSSSICESPPAIAPGDVGACIHRRAYEMASRPGSAKEVADAVLISCADAVSYKMASLPEGERDVELEKLNEVFPREAIRRVEQARAGNCTAS